MWEHVLLCEAIIIAAIGVAVAAQAVADLLKEINYLLGVLRWHRDRLHTTELVIIETGRKTDEQIRGICDAIHGHSEVVSLMSTACAASPHLIPYPDPAPTAEDRAAERDPVQLGAPPADGQELERASNRVPDESQEMEPDSTDSTPPAESACLPDLRSSLPGNEASPEEDKP